ncbi:MAG: uncharacterized protein QOI54_2095 [Actinomycetota bacterium]|nr:uncharacterized protein [Actinomycetota bacterium]
MGVPAASPPGGGPLRTCVGCRVRGPAESLLRVVARDGATVPDPHRRLPGRGAHLHPDPACLALAQRRRALPRALRAETPLDLDPLRAWIGAAGARQAAPRS